MAVEDSNTKRCTKCGETKARSEFHKMTTSRDGLRPDCKPCHIASSEAYRSAHPKYNAAYYAANIESERARCEEYRANNIKRRRTSDAAWYASNRERCLVMSAARMKANPEARRIYKQNRRARESGGKLSQGLSSKLYKLQRGKCACGCKQPLGDDYHLDHIMPLALGGTNTDDNIQLLRQRCNNQKHAKHPIEFMQSRGYLL